MAVFCRCGILRQTPAPGVHPAPITGTPYQPGTRPAHATQAPAHAR
jgi:hypothetical protein